MRYLVFVCLSLASGSLAIAADTPNIVLLLADDLGYGELGCQGNPEIPTPAIDSIAQHGIRFSEGYVTAPNCSPSRAGLLTGRIPTRFGYEFNPIGARNEDPGTGMPTAELTIAELLQRQGYTTGLIGKWHLGGAADFHPYRHGFDEFFGFAHEGHYFVPPPYRDVTTMLRRLALPGGKQGRWISDRLIYSTHMGHSEPDYDANNPIVRGGQPVQEETYLTDAFTREAVDFIERHQDKPFFLYVAYNAVHSPLQAKQEHMERFSHIEDVHRRIFAGMLAALDESVGQILQTLQRRELDKNTLVIFLSDNGGPTRELTSSNAPLRGGKGSMYEGGLRVPFMIRWNGTLPAGQVYDKPVSSLDLFPTIATAAGASLPESLDGTDLVPFLTGKVKGSPREELYWRQGRRSALRQENWKLVRQERQDQSVQLELYNLAEDMQEAKNLGKQYPRQLQRMEQRWHELNGQMREPLFLQR